MTTYHPATTESLLLALRRPIALVGNGHPGRALGAMIDRYPTVIRFNDYRLPGFEQLVGHRTTVRAVNGWTDIAVRDGVIAVTPFTVDAIESAHLQAFRDRSPVPVLHAATDIHPLLPQVAKPSTGLALAALASHLGLEVDCFGFDGFRTGHYWDQHTPLHTTHAREERDVLLQLPGVTLYGASYDYAALYDYCHRHHAAYDANEGLMLFTQLGLTCRGERVLEFGAGNGALSHFLEQQGARVTAVEVSEDAFSRISILDKILGDALTLGGLSGGYDRFVSVDVLEHLTENDVRIVVREAARLAQAITVSVCTRPSGLVGPQGENLHLTVRPVRWWIEQFSRHFEVTVTRGTGVGQLVLQGHRRVHIDIPSGSQSAAQPSAVDLALPIGYQHRCEPEYFVDSLVVTDGVTWQPDVYAHAAQLARELGCTTIIDVGCGQARKLTALSPEFRIIGIDYGTNIQHCREMYPIGTWLETDLERYELLPIPDAVVEKAVVVCSDVIEHLVDPRPLLSTLQDLLHFAPAAIITSPDRVRTHGVQHLGPPPNPAHTREWTAEELATLCRRAGLTVGSVLHTRSNDAVPDLSTLLLVLHGQRARQPIPRRLEPFGMIPSAQKNPAGTPRFHVPVALSDPAYQVLAHQEAHGGVDADHRIFLDAQLEPSDLFLDIAPGHGFLALSAATAPAGVPTVFVDGVEQVLFERWQQSATAAGGQLTAESLDATIQTVHASPHGRVFVRARIDQVQAVVYRLAESFATERVAAVCLDAWETSDTTWHRALAALSSVGFAPCELIEDADGIVLMPSRQARRVPTIALLSTDPAFVEAA